MKTMTSRMLLVFFSAIFIYSSCPPEHKHHRSHQILSLPYLKNAEYLRSICERDSSNSKCWPYKSCTQNESHLSYIPFFCGNSLRPQFTGHDSTYFIYVPYYEVSNNYVNLKMDGFGNQGTGQISTIPKMGSFGCNYFLPTERAISTPYSLPFADSNSVKVTNTKLEKRPCRLDYFTIGNRTYINLLFISHANEVLYGTDTITSFSNVDYAISPPDYIKLDSLLRKYPSLTGGIDTPNIRKLYLYNGGIHLKIDSITSPITPIFPNIKINVPPYKRI